MSVALERLNHDCQPAAAAGIVAAATKRVLLIGMLALLPAGAQAQTQPPPQQQRLNAPQTLGRYLTAGMAMVGVSMDSLARLCPWLGARQSVRVGRISAIREGEAPINDTVLVRLAAVLDSIFYARADTDQVPHATQIYHTAHTYHRPTLAPVETLNISSAGVTGNGKTYFLDILEHGIPNLGATVSIPVVVRNHHATPSFDGVKLYAKWLSVDRVSLWLDSAMTQGVIVTANGSGGQLQWRP